MLKFVIFGVVFVPSIRAALSNKEMESALIAARETETLEKTFKKYERERDAYDLSLALTGVSKVQACMPKAVACLRMVHDPFPEYEMCVSGLVHVHFVRNFL